jgi:hypothetical protein
LGSSWREPDFTQIPIETERMWFICSVRMVSPLGNTARWMLRSSSTMMAAPSDLIPVAQVMKILFVAWFLVPASGNPRTKMNALDNNNGENTPKRRRANGNLLL